MQTTETIERWRDEQRRKYGACTGCSTSTKDVICGRKECPQRRIWAKEVIDRFIQLISGVTDDKR
jgi:hypothetical protein